MKLIKRLWAIILVFALLLPTVSALDLPGDAVPDTYGEMFPVPEAQTISRDELCSVADTLLKDKSILFFGDSLTSGYGLDLYSKSWCGMLGSHYGMNVTCWSIAGSTMGINNRYGYYPGGHYEPMCKRSIPTGDFDVIFVEGGGNDWYCEIPLGSDPYSRNEKNFMGAVNVIIDRLQEAHPDALLLFSTSWNTTGKKNGLGLNTDDYNRAMLTVCQNRGVICFEACDPEISGIDSSSEGFRQEYFLTSADFWHLNVVGNEMYLETAAAWLQEMIQKYYYVSPFHDVRQRDWYGPAVQYAVKHGIVQGTDEHTFSPDLEMNRAMMVTLLYRTAGSPDVSGLANPFVDVPGDSFYYNAVLWGYDAGVIKGVSEEAFCPNDTLTRQQMVTMLYRYHGLPEPVEEATLLDRFSDRDLIAPYAEEAMVWAVGQGVIEGMGDGTVAPNGSANRAQMVQILWKYDRNMTE